MVRAEDRRRPAAMAWGAAYESASRRRSTVPACLTTATCLAIAVASLRPASATQLYYVETYAHTAATASDAQSVADYNYPTGALDGANTFTSPFTGFVASNSGTGIVGGVPVDFVGAATSTTDASSSSFGTTYSESANVAASLRTGTLTASVTSSSGYSYGETLAATNDMLTFTNSTPHTQVLGVHWFLHGTWNDLYTPGLPPSPTNLVSGLDLTSYLAITSGYASGAVVSLFAGNTGGDWNNNPFEFIGGAGFSPTACISGPGEGYTGYLGWAAVLGCTSTISDTGVNMTFSAQYPLPIGVDQLSIAHFLSVGSYGYGATGNGSANIDPMINFVLPVGVCFTSASGVFLGGGTQCGTAVTTAPEPGTLALMGVGLAAIGVIRRKYRHSR